MGSDTHIGDAVFVREQGAGPPVLCLHANASNSGQWRGLIDKLAPLGYHVLATDAYGAGRSPPWPMRAPDRPVGLRDEVALIAPVLARTNGPAILVGHSYGAAVALLAALAHPQRVRALVLYEPTLFALVDAVTPPPNDADGIRMTVDDAQAAVLRGDLAGAAARFIDYWMGHGAWDRTPVARQGPIAASMRNVRGWATALFGEPTPLQAFAGLRIPVLLLVGGRSPRASLAVARLLQGVLPQVQVREFESLGHMGPLTDPAPVNDAIVQFVCRQPLPVVPPPGLSMPAPTVPIVPAAEGNESAVASAGTAAGSAAPGDG